VTSVPAEPGEPVDLQPPPDVRRIARRLQDAGFEAWAVGGAVRDALAGGHPKDWDLTTSAHPGVVRRLFKRTVPIGIEHGTVGVLGRDGHLYEVTTFRRDVETFGRRARVTFSETLEEDLERRDFTINAVAWDPISGELRDPHRGCEDLRERLLRTVGDPARRFEEDYLRVLRALRFAGRFSLRIDPATWSALRAAVGFLHGLSAERVREELLKLLRELDRPSESLSLYESAGVLRELYPELQECVGVADMHNGGDVWSHLLATTDAVPRHRTRLRLAALFHDLGVPESGPGADHAAAGAAMARGILQRLRSSNEEIDLVIHLVAQHADFPATAATDPEIRRWIRRVGADHLPDLFRLRFAAHRARGRREPPRELLDLLRRVRSLLRRRPPLAIVDLAVGGDDLRRLGIPPGPLYGEILRDLLERVTDDPELNQPERLREIVRQRIG
jgi:tRNA nucleotidyltransferase (CCA-adding enzyme)